MAEAPQKEQQITASRNAPPQLPRVMIVLDVSIVL
jgi:hypothetical protein